MKRGLIVLAVLGIVAISIVVFVPRLTRAYQLARARTRWDGCDIHSYTWSTGGGFFVGGGPVEIEVRDDRVSSATSAGSTVPRSELRTYPLTVPELFDRVAGATGADVFAVAYDEGCGFPRSVSVDPSRNTFDDGFDFEVADLRPNA
jgi:hypothetical protein